MVLSGGRSFAQSPYKTIDVNDGGTITGVVRLDGVVPKSAVLEITKDNDWCGRKKTPLRLVLGKNNSVRYAVVSLERIAQGKKMMLNGRFLLDQRKCEYEPHVMLLPKGAPVEIVNSDTVLHNVHAYEGDGMGRTAFNIAQPVKGFRYPVPPVS